MFEFCIRRLVQYCTFDRDVLVEGIVEHSTKERARGSSLWISHPSLVNKHATPHVICRSLGWLTFLYLREFEQTSHVCIRKIHNSMQFCSLY